MRPVVTCAGESGLARREELGSAGGGLLLAALVFAMIFKVVPCVQVMRKNLWPGALFAAILFALGKSLISLYIGRSSVVTGFGAAALLGHAPGPFPSQTGDSRDLRDLDQPEWPTD